MQYMYAEEVRALCGRFDSGSCSYVPKSSRWYPCGQSIKAGVGHSFLFISLIVLHCRYSWCDHLTVRQPIRHMTLVRGKPGKPVLRSARVAHMPVP
jgi:hypothetical protein